MPYTLSRGLYFWPFAYDVASIDDLTAHERELLAPLGPLESSSSRARDTSAGARVGAWVFFVAGDDARETAAMSFARRGGSTG